MRHRSSVWIAAVVLLASRTGVAQEQVRDADRGPRFLLASASGQGRLPVDVARTPSLRRRISIALEGVSLKQALSEIARKGNLSLVYSRDIVSLDSPVHLEAENITVAGALSEVLLDAGVDVVMSQDGRAALVKRPPAVALQTGTVVGRVIDKKAGTALTGATVVVEGTSRSATTGNDGSYRIADLAPGNYAVRARFIGYAPGMTVVTVSADQEVTADFFLEKSAQRLDEVVTTGTVVPTEVRALPTPVSVIDAEDLERQHVQRVDEVFRQLVPSAVSPEVSTQPELTFRSIRGASTLTGLSTVKVYVDGIEVADRSIALVDPSSVARIEVIRGPQAATIYGSDAIGGVMQIFTKRGDPALGRPEITTQAGLGLINSPYRDGALRQEYRTSVRGGASFATYNVGVGYERSGDWVDESAISQPSGFAGITVGQGNLSLDLSGRYYQQGYSFPVDPRAAETGLVSFSRPFHFRFVRGQETYGARLTYAPTTWWRHALSVGIDRFSDDVRNTEPRFITPADSLFTISERNERKAYIAYNTSVTVDVSRLVSAVITAGFEHSTLTDQLYSTSGALRNSGSLQTAPGFAVSASRDVVNNTGYFSQAQLGFQNRFFLTGGIRAEENSNFGAALGTPVSPRAGASFVQEAGPVTAKVRASYGEAILPPTPVQKNAFTSAGQTNVENPRLAPQRQTGVDAGLDLAFAEFGSVSVTYYAQTAKDLIQRVLLDASATPQVYQWQNVARVRNTGWEFEASARWGPAVLTAQYAITNSRVEDLGPNYTGDLTIGDRPLQVPHTTAGATLSLSPWSRTNLSVGFTYVGQRTNYDYLAQFRCFAGTGPCRASLRDYQMVYPSFALVNAALDQQVTPFLSGFVAVSNLTNNTADEVNNQIPPRGRLSMAGVRVLW